MHLLHRLAPLVVGAGLAAACTTPDLGTDAAAVQNYIVTVNTDGTFSPSTLAANEGDSVTFQGPGGAALRTTDAVVRVPDGNLGTSCVTTGQPYDITHLLPGDDNELTGPLRRGTSGIYALGPEEAEGYVEGAAVGVTRAQIEALIPGAPVELHEPAPAVDAACNAYATAAGVATPIAGVEQWQTVKFTGAATMLCRKHAIAGGDVTTTNARFVLDSTWDNPDLAGVVVRINWEDLFGETSTVTPPVETYSKDWSKLDHELDQAARRGKLVFLEVLAGDGIPPWLFDDYQQDPAGNDLVTVDATATGLAARSVTPIETEDYGSNGTGYPNPRNCGFRKTMGSPADPAYTDAVVAMIRDVAAHLRANGAYYQALGSFKVTGLNFLTGEMRLPHRCLVQDPTKAPCWCNSRIWAAPLGSQVAAYDPTAPQPAAPLVNGGGYSNQAAQDFMRTVENTLYWELGRRKTMHYMLIQDGFPKVDDEEHYDMDVNHTLVGPWLSPWGATNYGYVDAVGNPIGVASQTQDALDSGRNGEFAHILPGGAPGVGGALEAHSLFAVMHAGLERLPVDASGVALGTPVGAPVGDVPDCAQQSHHPATLVNGTFQAALSDPSLPVPGGFNDVTSYGQPGDHCPNKWAVREGYRNQVIGFQTTNDLTGADDLSSVLWNATLESNAVFLEAYERVLWQADQVRRTGGTALSTTAAGYAEIPERQKSLAQWAAELHGRRRTLASLAGNATDRHMKDPFPISYTFNFKKDLAAGAVESYRFINPAVRCSAGTLASGRINVTGL